jgi:hypothetical protein
MLLFFNEIETTLDNSIFHSEGFLAQVDCYRVFQPFSIETNDPETLLKKHLLFMQKFLAGDTFSCSIFHLKFLLRFLRFVWVNSILFQI